MKKNIFLADCCHYFHMLLSGYIVFGNFLNNKIHSKIILLLSFGIVTNWAYFNDCILNKIEDKLRGNNNVISSNGFLNTIIMDVLGIKLSSDLVKEILPYYIIIFSFIWSYFKIIH